MSIALHRAAYQLEEVLALRNRMLAELRATELDLPAFRELCSTLEIFETAETELARVAFEGSAAERRAMSKFVTGLVAATPIEELRAEVHELIASVDRFAELPPEL